ncbi:MAG: hypothetical protein GC191_20650 [Azospirillum sp.]|nr:hypothetical protein [Azospirillum sp.]
MILQIEGEIADDIVCKFNRARLGLKAIADMLLQNNTELSSLVECVHDYMDKVENELIVNLKRPEKIDHRSQERKV